MTKKSILVLFVCCLAFTFIVTLVALLRHLQQSQPRLIQICHVNDVIAKCPEIVTWIKTRNPCEWVPDSCLLKIISNPVQEEEILFATYEMEITAFKPYTFHAVKGTFEGSQGSDGHIYIYAWDKRYSPMLAN